MHPMNKILNEKKLKLIDLFYSMLNPFIIDKKLM
jgi:hypothetical protein